MKKKNSFRVFILCVSVLMMVGYSIHIFTRDALAGKWDDCFCYDICKTPVNTTCRILCVTHGGCSDILRTDGICSPTVEYRCHNNFLLYCNEDGKVWRADCADTNCQECLWNVSEQ